MVGKSKWEMNGGSGQGYNFPDHLCSCSHFCPLSFSRVWRLVGGTAPEPEPRLLHL